MNISLSPTVIPEEPKEVTPAPPSCYPNPCGPYSICEILGPRPVCHCQPGYLGRPPNCRPECVLSSQCASNLACINEKCSDPCVGVCGINALCFVNNHNPICSCERGFEGDPFRECVRIPGREKDMRPNIIYHFNASWHLDTNTWTKILTKV